MLARLAAFTVIVASFVLSGGAVVAVADRPLATVRVVGASPLTEADLRAWLQAHLPDSTLAADPDDLRTQMLSDLPLADATVERRVPGRLRITVKERTPYATLIAPDGSVQVLDRDARPVSLRDDQKIALWDRPLVRGCAVPVTTVAGRSCARKAIGALSWLDVRRPDWLPALSELRVVGGGIDVMLVDGREVRLSPRSLAKQLDALAHAWSIAKAQQLKPAKMIVIDASHVVLQTNATTTQTTQTELAKKRPERRKDEA